MGENANTPKPPQDALSPEVTRDQLDQFDAEVRRLLAEPSIHEPESEDDHEVDEGDAFTDKSYVKNIDGDDVEIHIEKLGPEIASGPGTTVELAYNFATKDGGRIALRKTFTFNLYDLSSKYDETSALYDSQGYRVYKPDELPPPMGSDDEAVSSFISKLIAEQNFKEQLGEDTFTQERFNEVMGVLGQLTPADEEI